MSKSFKFIFYPFNESQSEFNYDNFDTKNMEFNDSSNPLSGQGILFDVNVTSSGVEISYTFTHDSIAEAATTPGHPMCLPIDMKINDITTALTSQNFADENFNILKLQIGGFPPGPNLIAILNSDGNLEYHLI